MTPVRGATKGFQELRETQVILVQKEIRVILAHKVREGQLGFAVRKVCRVMSVLLENPDLKGLEVPLVLREPVVKKVILDLVVITELPVLKGRLVSPGQKVQSAPAVITVPEGLKA